jgi:hypothetical protein
MVILEKFQKTKSKIQIIFNIQLSIFNSQPEDLNPIEHGFDG